MTKKYIAKQSITIHAPAFKVWQALITPDIIRQYLFGAEVLSDWREGSSIVFRGTWDGKPYEDKGEILKIEPEKLLATTYWSAFSGLPDSPENYQRVTYELLNQGRKTVLTVTQDDILSEEGQSQADKNWQSTLNALKTLVEK